MYPADDNFPRISLDKHSLFLSQFWTFFGQKYRKMGHLGSLEISDYFCKIFNVCSWVILWVCLNFYLNPRENGRSGSNKIITDLNSAVIMLRMSHVYYIYTVYSRPFLRIVQMGVHFTFEFNLGDRRTRLENWVTSSSIDSQSI